MFLPNSRYAQVPTTETTTADGRRVAALGLRRLPPTAGEPVTVRDHDRLDLIAHARTGDGTRFWHVADANTALDARTLAATTGETLRVPEA